MKKTIILSLIFFSLFSTLVFSKECVIYKSQTFCVGDRAVAETSDGEIIGVSKNKISLDFTNSSTSNSAFKKNITTFNIDQIYLGKGCFGEICVGEMGVGLNDYGEIVGLSNQTKKVALRLQNKNGAYSQIKVFSSNDVTVKKGCLDTYCVGMLAIFKNFDGAIIGINKLAKKVSINFAGGTSKYVGIGTYELKTLGLGRGCLEGICVGDKAVSANFSGTVIAINPYLLEVSIQNVIIKTDNIKNITKGLKN